MMIALTVDSPLPILQLLHEKRLCVDVRFQGELKPYYENAGLRAHYFDKEYGLTIDEFGEQLLDRRYVLESPREEEILALLDQLFSAVDRKAPLRLQATEENAIGRSRERELAKARNNRYRTWKCDCGETLLRSARVTLRLTCGFCNGNVYRTERTVPEIMLDIPLETIRRSDYQPMVAEESVPF